MRTDLEVPVLVVSAETDLVGEQLGYARARQPDTTWFRSWEVAGTAHGDAYQLGIGDTDDGSGAGDAALFAAMSDPPRSVYFGIITCDAPINAGPQTYVLRAALAALAGWARTGEPPASMPRLELSADGNGYALDAVGNARGGVRTPQVDVPVARLSGLGQSGGLVLRACSAPPSRSYPTRRPRATTTTRRFVTRWAAATDAAVAAGTLLPVDGERLKDVAATSGIVR